MVSSPLLSFPLLPPRVAPSLLAIALALAGVVNTAHAQVQPAPNARVLHIWVDPVNGDNALAAAQNPQPGLAGACAPTDNHPHNVLDGGSPALALLHAPSPFKTVTAAISYVRLIQPTGQPRVNQNSTITTVATVIHCLPGLYGAGTALEVHNGLALNGESLPLVLPDMVSIQGTNALNTVFVGNGNAPVFQFGSPGNASPQGDAAGPTQQFLANISVTGAIRLGTYGIDANHPTSTPFNGAAIFVDHSRFTNLLVVNCVLYCNATAVLVDALQGVTQQAQHRITLINNTLAWNVCGVWNGQISTTANVTLPNASQGLAFVSMVNNLIDSMPVLDQSGNLEIPLSHLSGTRPMPDWWSRWKSAVTAVRQSPLGGTYHLIDLRTMTNVEGMAQADAEALDPANGLPSPVNFNGLQS